MRIRAESRGRTGFGRLVAGLAAGLLAGLAWAEPAATPEAVGPGGAEPDSIVLDWADQTVARTAVYLGESVNWFDAFFDDERYSDENDARIQVRWRNDLSYRQDESGVDFKSRVSARANLPHFNNKLKLELLADDDDSFTGDRDQTVAIEPENFDRQGNSLGVRYDLRNVKAEHLSLSGSVRVDPLQFITKVRYRKTYPLSKDMAGRLTSTGYWNTREGFGTKLTGDLERTLSKDTLVRWSNSVAWDEEDLEDGWKWSSMGTHYHRLSGKKAISYSAGVVGVTRPDPTVENYFVRVRYRQNVWRPWLFTELVPEVYWPQDGRKEECTTCLALMTRAEVVFRKWE